MGRTRQDTAQLRAVVLTLKVAEGRRTSLKRSLMGSACLAGKGRF